MDNEKRLNQLVEKLRKAYADRLVSVVLYGSAAGAEAGDRFSDVNILCVLTEVTVRELRDAEEIFRFWQQHGNPSPLLLAESELAASTSSFAIEFRDLARAHRVLHGKDVISPLALDDSFYRVQLEHDLRAKLFRLRQKAAGMIADDDLLRRLLADSVSTFCVLFRHALALHGHEAPPSRREVIAEAQRHFGLNPEPFLKLLDLREQRIKPREVNPFTVLAPYLDGINKVIAVVAEAR